MTVENRAKQFAPFSALTGLDLALEKKRRELDRSERREFSEASAAELNERLRALQRAFEAGQRPGPYCGHRGDRVRRALPILPRRGIMTVG